MFNWFKQKFNEFKWFITPYKSGILFQQCFEEFNEEWEIMNEKELENN